MKQPEPSIPSDVDPLAKEILYELRRHRDSIGIVLGGYFALKHYLDYRPTHDIDAWWAQEADEETRTALTARIKDAVAVVAKRHNYELVERKPTGKGVLSFGLKGQDKKTRFSFQIADRTIEIEPPVNSPWFPIRIESLRDNIASKMCALVDRGAPRDFRDVYEVVQKEILDIPSLWELYHLKNPDVAIDAAKAQVLKHIASIEMRRPLDRLEGKERQTALEIRSWAHSELGALARIKENENNVKRPDRDQGTTR